MKKQLIYITILIISIIIVMTVIFNICNNNKINNITIYEDIPNKKSEEITNNINENTYIDDNTIKIGLYTKKGNNKKLTFNYSSNWNAEEIIGIFYAVATNEDKISNNSFEKIWKSYWNKYDNSKKYKIGYNIKFTINNQIVDKLILNPDDAYTMYPKLQLYLYDDVNLIPGRPYYHVTNETMVKETLFTSVKLVGDTNTKYITSPIELTVFTYHSDDDFDNLTGKYRGNSYYTTIINKK
ncbi:MAG: hypothetical protein RR136_02510 [Clostridia bacterium]